AGSVEGPAVPPPADELAVCLAGGNPVQLDPERLESALLRHVEQVSSPATEIEEPPTVYAGYAREAVQHPSERLSLQRRHMRGVQAGAPRVVVVLIIDDG